MCSFKCAKEQILNLIYLCCHSLFQERMTAWELQWLNGQNMKFSLQWSYVWVLFQALSIFFLCKKIYLSCLWWAAMVLLTEFLFSCCENQMTTGHGAAQWGGMTSPTIKSSPLLLALRSSSEDYTWYTAAASSVLPSQVRWCWSVLSGVQAWGNYWRTCCCSSSGHPHFMPSV